MSAVKKIIQQKVVENLDEKTGELKQVSSEKLFTFPSEPPYVKLYLDDVTAIYKLPDGSHRALLELLKKLDYEGKISLNKTNKESICKNIGWKTVASLDNYLSKHLVKKGVFRKEGTGVYIPDPHLFGRGKWQDIYKNREAWLKVKYDQDGNRTVTSSFDDSDQNNA